MSRGADASHSAGLAPFPSAGGHPRLGAGVWRLADPKISLASFASIFLGAMVAWHDGPLAAEWLLLTVVGVFAVEVAKNASGEIFDFDSGADQAVAPEDRSPFSGGKRVLVDGVLTRQQTLWVAAAGYAAGALSGLLICWLREPQVLWLGVIGMALAFFYQAPPLRLSYRGWGEVAVAVSYGPLICCGTYLVQRGDVPGAVVAASVPLGILIAAFLWINEFPDYRADRAAEKRTLVVRLGRRRASRVFAVVLALAFVCLGYLPLAGVPVGIWAGFIALPAAVRAARVAVDRPEHTAAIIPAQVNTLRAFVLLAVGSGLGMVLL